MLPELSAAVYGAVAGGTVMLLFKIGEWFFGRQQQKKATGIGFYFEIDNHYITELESEEGQPNFVLTGFSDNVYKNELPLATKLFNAELVQALVFYYSRLKSTNDYQKELFEVNSKIASLKIVETASMVPPAGFEKLKEQREGILDILRVNLATAQHIRQYLLSELKKVFKEDPSKKKFIDVLPKHKEWFKKRGGYD